jgi:hypothetical protein
VRIIPGPMPKPKPQGQPIPTHPAVTPVPSL